MGCNPNEQWKNIEGYEGLYEISNLGRIKRLHRVSYYANGRKYVYKELILKLKPSKFTGYVNVGLTNSNHVMKTFRVHRLVAKVFIPNPYSFEEINHIDYDKENNQTANLEWCDRFYNNKHSSKKPSRKWQKHRLGLSGEDIHNSKPVIQKSLCGETINTFKSGNLASKVTNVHQSKISAVCIGKRKTAGGYTWKFLN